jgi:hypothetical protein
MDIGPVKIFTFSDVPRLRYIIELLLGEILGISWEIVTDKRKLGKSPVINYSAEEIKGSFTILPHSLLSESGLKKQDPVVTDWKGLPVFFQTSEISDIPFDIFAASFFLVSRYEEYLEFEPDQFGRFKGSQSFAFQNNFLLKPVIDLWTKEFAKALLGKFRNIAFKKSTFRALVTIDVDQPFAYLGKDLFRSLGGLLVDVSHNDSGKAAKRFRTVTKGEKDPYDVFDYIFEMIGKNKTEAMFFIPVGNRSQFDKNPSWQNADYRKLILNISQKYPIGLHPSFGSSDHPEIMATEKQRLQTIVSGNILTSRFHYIKMSFPDSYKNLITAGINEDYSMGYPDEPGFRAGIARPFYFYDLAEEKKSSLRIWPFQIMDGTLYKYKGMNPESASETIASIINETRMAGGIFISLWHNTSLLDDTEWRKWRGTFELMLKLQQP